MCKHYELKGSELAELWREYNRDAWYSINILKTKMSLWYLTPMVLLEEEFVIDILEPHNPTRIDNLGKAKDFAEYARQNHGVGRIQLIRKGMYAAGNDRFIRLDMAKSSVRDKLLRAMTNDD